MIKKLLYPVLYFSTSFLMTAQNHSYFLGRKNLIGVDYNVSISNLIYNKGEGKLPVSITFRYEQILNKSIIAGVSLMTSNANFYDEFSNEGKTSNYYIDYNGIQRNVNNGKGNLNLKTAGLFLNSRFFRKSRTTIPIGNFWGFRTGITFNRLLIPKDYELSYTQYYGTLRKEYVINENQTLNFNKFHVGIEYGKTSRFFSDHLFFTYSLAWLYTPGKRFDPAASLNERFLSVAEKNLIQNQLLSLNLGLSYAF